ncbi:IclR family transcriptional regulator domain-containing protein [Streptomyces sp. NPDC001858]
MTAAKKPPATPRHYHAPDSRLAVLTTLILGQHTVYQLDAAARARLNSAFIAMSFVGGAVGSELGSVVYHAGGWTDLTALGAALPLNAGASALVLPAWSPQDEARSLLQAAELHRFTQATLTDVDALMERLGRIRRIGYSVTRGELDPDVVGIAAPIRNENEQVVTAVSVAALASRVYPEAEMEIAQKVLAAAAEISDRMAVVTG